MTKPSGTVPVHGLLGQNVQRDNSEQQRRAYVRQNILHEHLERAIRNTAPSSQNAAQSLTLMAALQPQASNSAAAQHGESRPSLPGGLFREDMINLAPVAPHLKISSSLMAQLELELRHTLLEVAEYYSGGSDDGDETDGDARLGAATRLPQAIEARKTAIAQHKESLRSCRARVLQLIDDINSTHPALESRLLSALETIPPHLRAARTARAELLATTIETALLKLSLLRARAHKALYGFTPPPPGGKSRRPASTSTSTSTSANADAPEAVRTVAAAVSRAYEALRARQRAQEEEMRSLDGQIAAYEGVLGLVDGRADGRGAYARVVSDMARVRKETEECRRELLRLGWTEG